MTKITRESEDRHVLNLVAHDLREGKIGLNAFIAYMLVMSDRPYDLAAADVSVAKETDRYYREKVRQKWAAR